MENIFEEMANITKPEGIHKRQITEKELKLAAKELRLKAGLIDHIINKVREMQSNSKLSK